MLNFLQTIVFAASLALLMRSLQYFTKIWAKDHKLGVKFLVLFPMLEVVAWIGFVFWAVKNHFEYSDLYQFMQVAIILVLVVFVAWFFVRDIIAGISFRMNPRWNEGQGISLEGAPGIIRKLDYLGIEFQNQQGELRHIPYSKLSAMEITHRLKKGEGSMQKVSVEVSQKYGSQKIQESLKKIVLELPWVVAPHDLKIHLKPNKDCYQAEIEFSSLDEDMLLKTEEIVRKFTSETFP